MPEPVIGIHNVTKVFHLGDTEVRALDRVTLTVAPGEFVAIMGSSGSGKSTLMNILGCLDRPTSGDYCLEGVDIATLDEPALARIRSRRIGFVFQNFNLLARTSALENVALPLFYSGQPGDATQRAREALASMGLASREQNSPSQLSGGQQQRVAIARALINDPAILLADEPTGNLDSKTADDILATLRTFNRERGLTVVLVTHEPDMAAYADRIITMRDGRIVTDSPNVPTPVDVAPGAASPHPPPQVVEEAGSPAHQVVAFARMALVAAGRAIARNTLRSGLTMLGIFIGVAALIAMVAVGQGAKAAVKARIEALGTNLLVVLPGATTSSGVRSGLGSASTLRTADAIAIKQEDPAVAEVSYLMRSVAQVQTGNQNWSTSIQGVTPSYLTTRNWAVVAGRPMTDDDMENAARVALLGQTVLKNLFGEHSNPIGATVLVKGVPLEVVGVLAAKGQSGFGQDQDDVVLIPFSTAERKVLGVTAPTQSSTIDSLYPAPPNPFGIRAKLTGYVSTIFVQATSTAQVPAALDQVTATLRRRHGIRPGGVDDFGVRNMNDITQAAEGSSQVMAMLLAAVASISLMVGGIGIMNILLVSVTERTREIGIRMAIGARRTHVLLQFLVEAILLSAGGGGAGVVMGVAVSAIISAVAHWPTALSPAAIVGAFFFSAAVGIFFGYHPARQASHLNPIEALRYE